MKTKKTRDEYLQMITKISRQIEVCERKQNDVLKALQRGKTASAQEIRDLELSFDYYEMLLVNLSKNLASLKKIAKGLGYNEIASITGDTDTERE